MFKKIWNAIRDFFRKLFGIKKKETECKEYVIRYSKVKDTVTFFAEPKVKK